jgi:hypothetical protein
MTDRGGEHVLLVNRHTGERLAMRRIKREGVAMRHRDTQLCSSCRGRFRRYCFASSLPSARCSAATVAMTGRDVHPVVRARRLPTSDPMAVPIPVRSAIGRCS